MNVLNKLSLKNLKLNKKRTIVTIIGITLSVALVTAVANMYASGIKSLIRYETIEKGNFHVSFKDVDKDDLTIFKNNRNIEKINLVKNTGYAKIDSKNEDKPYAYIKAFTEDSLNDLSVKLVSGRMPTNDLEILIPTHLKTNGRLEYNVGDTITLSVGKRVSNDNCELKQSNPYNKDLEKIIDTSIKTYKIVGIIERPATNIEEYTAPGYTFITYIDEFKIDTNMDIYVRYTKKGTKDAYKVTADILEVDSNLFKKLHTGGNITNEEFNKLSIELDNTYSIDINTYLIGLETNPITTSGIGGLGIVVIIVIAIIINTSVFCIRNSFDISITEKIKQYGMLRSIGATKKQIKKNVFYEAMFLGIIGIPLGVLFGFIASYLLVIISNYYLTKGVLADNLTLDFAFSYIAILLAIILGILTIYLSARKSAKKASIITPIDSIRNSADIQNKKIKSSKLIKNTFGIGGEISYKNLKRNKKKYRTTVISIIVSVFTFIALSSFMNIAFDTVDEELKISEYNVGLFIKNYDKNNYSKYEKTTEFDNIEDSSIIRNNQINFNNVKYNPEYLEFMDLKFDKDMDEYINIYTLGDYQYKKYLKTLGLDYEKVKDKVILFDKDILVNQTKNNKKINKSMRLYDYQKGDVISGKIDDNPVNLIIESVTDVSPFGLKNTSGTKIIVSDEYFDKITESYYLDIKYKSNNADKLQDNLEEYMKNESSYMIENIAENAKTMNNLFTLVGIFLYGFIIVISLIGITNIFNTVTSNMEFRKQEFAMLKSIGMTNKEFNRMIRLESLFMGMKSLLYSIPIGISLSYLIYKALSRENAIKYHVPFLAITISICVVFILISLIMKYSINKINKQNTIETIRNENI